MKVLLLLLFFPIGLLHAQTTISGKITGGHKREPLAFANVALEGTYDGASTNENGEFSFSTSETGKLNLKVSMIGYNDVLKEIESADSLYLTFEMKESINSLNAVVVTAGMFEASDEKKMVMLKPLDIVTTAGGGADIVGVMQFLPGATRVGDQTGLFVRGGSANETKTLIDGMIVQNPFFSSTPDVPQRGRFSPFMFKGTAFSTGGYSAQYGQALSSVLLLNTMDKQSENSNLNLGLNMAGVSASYTHKGWVTGSLYYSNVTPYFALAKPNLDFKTIPQGLGGAITINEVLKNTATLKIYGTFSDQQSSINLPTYQAENQTYLFANRNKNTFSNASYRQTFDNGNWILLAGASYSNNLDKLKIDNLSSDRSDERTQTRLVMSRLFGNSNSSTLSFGGEFHHITVSDIFNGHAFALIDRYAAAFVESEFYFNPRLATRVGFRTEHSSALQKANIAPRLSMAYKLGANSQISLAAGRFYQNPEKQYLYLNPKLNYERADHLILNYQIIKNKRTFRTELFYKKYNSLVKEQVESFDPNLYRFPTGSLNNAGSGYAQGFDVFFRDQKTLANGDLWVSYSYLDTQRDFANYTQKTIPGFATKHNLSMVYKQFFTKIMTNIGLTFSHTSGRPIYQLNDDFKQIKYTKSFENLSLMASHIRIKGKNTLVLYGLIDNILGRKNVFGYRYSADGSSRFEVRPLFYRTAFVGLSWTIGQMNGRSKEADLDF